MHVDPAQQEEKGTKKDDYKGIKKHRVQRVDVSYERDCEHNYFVSVTDISSFSECTG